MNWALFVIGAVLTLASFGVRLSMRGRLLPPVFAGTTMDQRRQVRKALYAGVLPADPALHDLALAQARRDVNNVPLSIRYLPIGALGVVLIVFAIAPLLPLYRTTPVVASAVGVVTLWYVSRRTLINGRRVLEDSTTGMHDPR